jgi:hypothetical protein
MFLPSHMVTICDSYPETPTRCQPVFKRDMASSIPFEGSGAKWLIYRGVTPSGQIAAGAGRPRFVARQRQTVATHLQRLFSPSSAMDPSSRTLIYLSRSAAIYLHWNIL